MKIPTLQQLLASVRPGTDGTLPSYESFYNQNRNGQDYSPYALAMYERDIVGLLEAQRAGTAAIQLEEPDGTTLSAYVTRYGTTLGPEYYAHDVAVLTLLEEAASDIETPDEPG